MKAPNEKNVIFKIDPKLVAEFDVFDPDDFSDEKSKNKNKKSQDNIKMSSSSFNSPYYHFDDSDTSEPEKK